jgi:hypothetical protein
MYDIYSERKIVLKFRQVYYEITKEEINIIIEQNKIEWGKQILSNHTSPYKSELITGRSTAQ